MQTTTVYQGLVYDLIYAEYIVHFALSKLHYPAFGLRQLLGRAAMVFEETAGATPELAHLEPLVGSRS